MTPTSPPEALLSPHWAFVVQLWEGTLLRPAQLSGRVEHITSGQAAAHWSGILHDCRPQKG
jgi:hypothetical protein